VLLEISRAWNQALRDRALSPYPYLAPIVQRAARIADPPVNPTPHRVVYTRGSMRLLHFAPTVRHATPILFVYSLINRYYILDFLPGRSLIEFMRDQGFDVYAIDWGTPGDLESRPHLGGHVQRPNKSAVALDPAVSGAKDLTMYGYCMGGTMALAHAALYPKAPAQLRRPGHPRRLPRGRHLPHLDQARYFDVDAMVDAHGNVPIDLMETGFSMMAPVQRITKWLDVFRRIDDPEFVTTFLAMEKWASDNVPFPGELYRQYIKRLLPGEQFLRGPHGRRRPHRRPRPDHLPAPDGPLRHRRHRPAAVEHGPGEQGGSTDKTTMSFPSATSACRPRARAPSRSGRRSPPGSPSARADGPVPAAGARGLRRGRRICAAQRGSAGARSMCGEWPHLSSTSSS
jgi:polyhydroxyalkanoate synthase